MISGMTMPEWPAALSRGDYLAALRSLRASLDDTQLLSFDMLIYVLQAVGSFGEADALQARRSELERSLGAESLPAAIREVLASLADTERQPEPAEVTVVDASSLLEQAVREHRITILCEEHPHPEHRVLGARMIPRLRQAGVTHLALETGMQGPLEDARHTSRVTPTTDGFSFEPQRARLLRVAFQELQVVAFDMDDHDFEWVQTHPDELITYRERRMAEHIIERILQPEPTARILVWVGHGHGQKGSRFKMMAQHLWDLVGDEPFSVYQLTGDGRRPGVDAVVRHPMPTYENGRPDWLRQDGRVSVTGSISASGAHLVQLHLASEGGGGTPVDQMVTRREGKLELLVPPDEYLLRIWGPGEQLVESRSLRVTTTPVDLQLLIG